jgi:hypothetical protein
MDVPVRRGCREAPTFVVQVVAPSGERRLALPISDEQFFAYLSGQRIVLVLEPHQRGFQVTHSLLQAAHLRDHTGIKPADVA